MHSAKPRKTIHFSKYLLGFFISILSPANADENNPEVITTENNKVISLRNIVELEDVLKTKNSVPLFFEARLTKEKHILHSSPTSTTAATGALDPMSILKIELSYPDYSQRKNDESTSLGRWRPLTIANSTTQEQVYFFDQWTDWKIIRLSSESPSLTYVGGNKNDVIFYKTASAEETLSCNDEHNVCLKEIPSPWQVQLLDTALIRDSNHQVQLRYKIQFNYSDELERVRTFEAWAPSRYFIRSTDHFEIMQHACVPIETFRDKTRPMKDIFADLDLLPKRRVAIQRLDKGMFSLVPGGAQSRNYGRFVKTKVVQEGSSDADITVIREEIEINTLYGGNIAFHDVAIDHKTHYSHVSFKSQNVNLSVYSYLPLFSDLELSVRGSVSIPTKQEYRDEIKNIKEELSDVYQLYVGQLFHFRYQDEGSDRKTNLGLGLSYRALMGTGAIQFGFDSLIGVSFVASFEWPKYILGARFEPIANNFSTELRNRDIELNAAYKLTNRDYEPNWTLFTRALSIEYHGVEQNSTLKSTEFYLGVGLGY